MWSYFAVCLVGLILGMAIQDSLLARYPRPSQELRGPALRIVGESPAEAIATATQLLRSFVFLNDRERAGRTGLTLIKDATARLNGALLAIRERKVG